VLGRSPIRSKLLGSNNAEDGGTLGGFPVQLLKRVARLSCVLAAKKEKIQRLGEMNSLAEKAVRWLIVAVINKANLLIYRFSV